MAALAVMNACYIIWISWIKNLISNLHEFKKEKTWRMEKVKQFLKQGRFQKYFIPPTHRRALTGRWLSLASLRVSYLQISLKGKAIESLLFYYSPTQFFPLGNGHIFLSNWRFSIWRSHTLEYRGLLLKDINKLGFFKKIKTILNCISKNTVLM